MCDTFARVGPHGTVFAKNSGLPAYDNKVIASVASYSTAKSAPAVHAMSVGAGSTTGTVFPGVACNNLYVTPATMFVFTAMTNSSGYAATNLGSLTYDSYLLEDVALSGGIEGVYESQASLGRGHLHSAGADNLEIGLDGDGLGVSAENARYSYLGVEDFSASTEYFGGAAGQSLELAIFVIDADVVGFPEEIFAAGSFSGFSELG